MRKIFLNSILLLCALIVGSTFAWGTDPVTIVSGSGTSGYSVPTGWTTNGTVEGGSYLKFDDGTITSSSISPHNSLSFTYTVATFGSGTDHPLTIRILNASTNEVIVEKTTATPTSSTYINTNSPLALGDISVPFKIQLYAPTGKGIRLRNYSITGTPASDAPKSDLVINLASTSGSTVYGTAKVVGYSLSDGSADVDDYDGTMAYEITNSEIADVEIGASNITFTPKAVGDAVVTIKAPATAFYNAAEDVTYTLTVTAPDGRTTALPAPVQLWTESWSSTSGSGGNDGEWNGSIGSSTIVADQTGWSTENAGGADNCLKAGSSSKKGTATTPAFGQAGDMIIAFRAGAWDSNSEQTELRLSVSGGGTLNQTSVDMTKGAFNDYLVCVKDATASTKLTFAGKQASSARFFLDDVTVSKGSVIQVTLNADGYATFCSEYPLDFSSASGYTAWQITDVTSSTITFSQITGDIKGGQGILLKGTANAKVTLTSADSEVTLGSNMLEGCTAPKYLAKSNLNYVLVHNSDHSEFQKLDAYDVTIPANKAYLHLPVALPSSAPDHLRIVFEENGATNINAIDATEEAIKFIENGKLYIKKNNVVYDALGRVVR